jgi:hypothetical protein
MPAIVNPQAVKFCNEKIRPLCDLWESLYETARRTKAAWDTDGLAVLIPNDTSPVTDGSATDGRNPITGAMVRSILDRIFETVTDLEAGGNAKLDQIRKVSVNGAPLF